MPQQAGFRLAPVLHVTLAGSPPVQAEAPTRNALMAIKRDTTLEAPQPRNIQRADMAPSEGFALVVDGRLKSNYDDEAAAKKAGADLLSRFPKLHVQIYDAKSKTRSSV